MKKSENLDNLRACLDTIDACIIPLVDKRKKAVLKMEKIKRKTGKPVVDKAIENRRIDMAMETARDLGMNYFSRRFIGKLLHKIIVHCRRLEQLQRMRAEKIKK